MNTSATHRPTQTNATQRERAEVLKNDRAVQKNTFLSHTHSEEGGRYAKPQTIVGSDSAVQYPMAAPNWANDPTGVEPPLNIDINAIEPCGEYFELGDVTTATETSNNQGIAKSQPVATSSSPMSDPAPGSAFAPGPARTPRDAGSLSNPKPKTRRV
jgi:hypothetical protein